MEFSGKLAYANMMKPGLLILGVVLILLCIHNLTHPGLSPLGSLSLLLGIPIISQFVLMAVLPPPSILMSENGMSVRIGFQHRFILWDDIATVDSDSNSIDIKTKNGKTFSLRNPNFPDSLPEISKAVERRGNVSKEFQYFEPKENLFFGSVRPFFCGLVSILATGFVPLFSFYLGPLRATVESIPLSIWWFLIALFIYCVWTFKLENTRMKMDENALSCWNGTEWKVVPWQSVESINVRYDPNVKVGGVHPVCLEVQADGVGFDYMIESIFQSDPDNRVMWSLHNHLGDRLLLGNTPYSQVKRLQ